MKKIKEFIGEVAFIICVIEVMHINVWTELKYHWKHRNDPKDY